MSDEDTASDTNFHLDKAWKTALDAAYHGVVIDYGNDGRPEDDRHQSAAELAAKDWSIAYLAARTGVPKEFVANRISKTAEAHGAANHDEYLQPPDWNDMTSWYSGAEHYAAAHGVADWGEEAHDSDVS